MPKWRGQAAVAPGGDWSHAGELNLKAETHPGDAAAKLGHAFGVAMRMAATGLDVVKRCETGDPAVLAVLRRHFGNDAGKQAHLSAIGDALRATHKGMVAATRADKSPEQKALHVVHLFDRQAGNGGQEQGYVRMHPPLQPGKIARGRPLIQAHTDDEAPISSFDHRVGHIHLNLDPARGETLERLARTILHEATHRYAGTGDFAYAGSEGYDDLQGVARINNADSYAEFCYRLVVG